MKSYYHCVYKLKYHLVLVTKYRRPCLTSEMLQHLEQIYHDLLGKWEVRLEEFGDEADHVHLMLDMHPNIMPSRLVNTLKTVMCKAVADPLKRYYWKPVLWTSAYCLVSAGGLL